MKPRNELFYFVPGQVILHLEHDEDVADPDLELAVETFLKDSSSIYPWNQLGVLFGQTVTFPLIRSNDGRVISLVLTHIIKGVPSIEEYRKHVYGNQDRLIALLVDIYDSLVEDFVIPNTNIVLRSVSPNWLMSGSPHLPGTGGPGSWPVKAREPVGNQWKFNFTTVPNYTEFSNTPMDEEMEVAILDTAPSVDMVDKARLNWPNHQLFQELIGSGGVLEIVRYYFSAQEMTEHHNDISDDQSMMDHFSLVEHRYPMPDHGLFVAGIIHSIAPRVRLKLYEALNCFGVGSYHSIAHGLNQILGGKKPQQKLVINMSLVLDMPFVDNTGFRHFDPGITDRYFGREKYFVLMSYSIQEIIEKLVGLENVLIVAAAGNDAHDPANRPCARYPAACEGVIGVGALPPKSRIIPLGPYNTASYSNLCDQPPYAMRHPYSGYVTFGGEAGEGQGVLGIYIYREFPDYNNPPIVNDTGWAWWAGTSFAAPIISGMLAAGWSKSWGGTVVIPGSGSSSHTSLTSRAHDFLIRASGFKQTIMGERVIFIRQYL